MKIIKISGAKNSILPILAATIIEKKIYIIDNVPLINDVFVQIKILIQFNVKINFINKTTLIVDTTELIIPKTIDYSDNTRGTYYFIGSTSSYNVYLEYLLNIGCKIDKRTIDYHIELLKLLGKEVECIENKIIISGNCLDRDIEYFFKKPSVGGTINALLMFSKSKSTIILNNYAKDPYIIDTIYFLRKINININWNETKIIINKKNTKMCYTIIKKDLIYHKLINDPIEALTWIIFSAINLKDYSFSNYSIGPINIKNLGNAYFLFKNIGIELIETNMSQYYIVYRKKLNNFNASTDYFPGIYTDIQPFLCILALHIKNVNCIITENIWNNRFNYIEQINKFSADIKINNNNILINKFLNKDNIKKEIINKNIFECTDLRGGMAIYLLMKKYNINKKPINKQYISRGYYNYEYNIDVILKNSKTISKNININRLSNINIGKISKYYYETYTINNIKYIIDYCNKNNIKYIFIGDGNNIYFSDYYDGMVIKNYYKNISFNRKKNFFNVSAGIYLMDFILYASKFGFDLSKLAGIPGTIGGAIYGNAGAYGKEFGEYVLECDILINNKIIKLKNEEMNFGYRQSFFKENKNYIIISSKIKINKSNYSKTLINKNIFDIIKIRNNKWPTSKTLGSIFKNPIIDNNKILVWKLIDQLNIRGKIINNIKILDEHPNIFLNINNTNYKDLNNLINFIKNSIFINNNIKIETEIEFIN